MKRFLYYTAYAVLMTISAAGLVLVVSAPTDEAMNAGFTHLGCFYIIAVVLTKLAELSILCFPVWLLGKLRRHFLKTLGRSSGFHS